MTIGKATEQFSLFDTEAPGAQALAAASTPTGKFSNFIVYVDESGDHSLHNVYPEYPLFVLAFCVFYKRHYAEHVVPALEKFKFNHFGHDLVILHENDIRKERGQFLFPSRQDRVHFMESLTGIIEQSNFILISCVIRKDMLRFSGGSVPPNPYHIALGSCLESLYEFLQEKQQADKQTHIVVECRGKKEDAELELEFRRICDGANRLNRQLPFEIILVDKKSNSTGLQLADLVARPIGLSVLRPQQENRPFEVLKRKLFCNGGRKGVGEGYEGWGLKIFPAPESEKPR